MQALVLGSKRRTRMASSPSAQCVGHRFAHIRVKENVNWLCYGVLAELRVVTEKSLLKMVSDVPEELM